jgi:hypothetical protein
MAETFKACCAKCGGTSLTYQDAGSETTFLVVPFAIPAGAPLDNNAIQRYAMEHAAHLSRILMAHREGRGWTGGLIVT